MSFFGIGPMELAFILIIMILVLGPKNMVSSAKNLGSTLRKIVKSPLWSTVMDTSREIRDLPNKLMREAALEEDLKEIKATTDSLKGIGNVSVTTPAITTMPSSKPKPKQPTSNPDPASEASLPVDHSTAENPETPSTGESAQVDHSTDEDQPRAEHDHQPLEETSDDQPSS